MADMLSRIAALERALETVAVGNPYIRKCTLVSADTSAWTATVRFGDTLYAGVQIAHQVKVECLVPNSTVLVGFNSFDSAYDAVLFVTFGGKPPLALEFDNVRGHAHRRGVPGDGAPIYEGDITDVLVER